jgi:hypothetical protein
LILILPSAASFRRRLKKLEQAAIRNESKVHRQMLALATDEELDDAIDILSRRDAGGILSVQDEERLAEIATSLHERRRLRCARS